MRPVSSQGPLPSPDVARRWTEGSAGARGARAGAAAMARAVAASGRDSTVAAGAVIGIEALLGQVPSHGVRGLTALLAPPPETAARGVAQLATALRQCARRARAAGGAADFLGRGAAAVPGGAQLQDALEREQRLGRTLEQLGALQDQVTAAMAAVSSG